ncbi:MAG: Rid family detoxifying hydrolase [Candidatus Alcyoniella australis]|nr:Rid family detoxifying hydrolase [Candidatus Alcyoniella australis]
MEKHGKHPLHTDQAPAAIGPYSQGVAVGRYVFTSGQLPIDPASGTIPEGIEQQARVALANVSAVLQAAGSGLDRAIKLTVFMTDIAEFAAFNAVYAEVFEAAGGSFPARSALQVAALPKPEARIEIEAVATI